LVALDCSWEHAEKVLLKQVKGTSRCLPILIAGNPVNFGKATKLTTAEALAAGLYIAGFKQRAAELLSIFTWGHTFIELNLAMLEKYALALDSAEIVKIQSSLRDVSRSQRISS
jgi:pre-rRNA-processing protein TSR3